MSLRPTPDKNALRIRSELAFGVRTGTPGPIADVERRIAVVSLISTRYSHRMDPRKRAGMLALAFAISGLVYFLVQILFGDPPGHAAIETAIWLTLLIVFFGVWMHLRAKKVRQLSDHGIVEGYIRRPEAPKGDPYRKWNYGLLTPRRGILTFQPVIGTTTRKRGEPFDIELETPASGHRKATGKEKLDRLSFGVVIADFTTDGGRLEIASGPKTLAGIESVLAGEPQEVRDEMKEK